MKRGIIAVVASVLVAALLGVHGSPVGAQPVASMTLPSPGEVKQLYDGCNNVALTFEDGTSCQTVVQAVAPPGAVQTMWRYDAQAKSFEGFSAAAPQPEVSDLQTVDFLDAVWLCVGEAAPAAPAPPAASPPAATATPVADLTPTSEAGTSPIEALESFAYALEMEMSIEADGGLNVTMAAEGLFEAPDSLTCTVSGSLGGLTIVTTDLVVIGDNAWIDTGDGFRATRASDPEVTDSLGTCPGSPTFWEDFEIQELTLLPGEPGTVNGVAARKYPLGEAMETLGSFGFLPSELEGITIHEFDIWVAEEGGWVVRLAVDVSLDTQALGDQFGFPAGEAGQQLRLDMQLDITNANSADIHVKPPAS